MATGLLMGPGQLASAVTNATALKYRLFFDITSGVPVPTVIDSAGTLYAFGGLTREAIEDAIGADLSGTATITPTYADNGAATATFTWDVNDGSVTNAKRANMAQSTISGRAAGAGTGPPTDLSAAQVSTILGLGSLATLSSVDNAHLANMAANTVKANPTGGSAVAQDITGASLLSNIIGPIANVSLAVMNSLTLKGNVTGGSATPTDLTATQVTASFVNDATLTTGTNLPGRMTAVEKTRLNRDRDLVADYGCDATGSVDCTAAFNTALAAGGQLTVPIGVFKVNTAGTTLTSSVDGTHVIGLSQRNSIIQPNHGTVDCLTVSGSGIMVENLRIQPPLSTTRTAGYAVNMTSAGNTNGVRNIDIIWAWSGVKSSGSLHFVDNANVRETSQNAASGACIFIDGTGDRYVRRLTSDNGANPTTGAGIRVKQCASVTIADCNIIHAGTCLDLDPTSGLTIASVNAVNCFFDTSVNGLSINGAAAAGSVFRCKFSTCWFSTHTTNGALLTGIAAGTAQFDGISFDQCEFFQNATGINCPTGGGQWAADNCKFAQNTTAVLVTPGTNHYPTITNSYLGAYAAFTINTTAFNVAAGTYKGLEIANNKVIGNTTALTLGAVTVTNWNQFRIVDNAGINPRGAVTTPALPAAGATVTNTTGGRVVVYWRAGGIAPTGITINGVANALASGPVSVAGPPIALDPGGTVIYVGNPPASWTWVGN